MNYVQGIEDLFEYITKYIEILIDFLSLEDFKNLLIYLFNCIPEPIKAVFFLTLLLFIVVGFVKAFRH